MVSDFKWLVDIIKSGNKITTGIAIACGLFLLLAHVRWLTTIEPWMILSATTGLLLFGSLSVVAFFSSNPIKNLIVHKFTIHKQKHAIRNYLPHMTEKEREIISYLLARNQKTFMYTLDGGYAASLISRGIIVCALRQGQGISYNHIPFTIPDHIWSVLWKHREKFPYKRPALGENEMHPWAIHWMAR